MADVTALENRLPPETKDDSAKSDISLKERFFRYFQHEITDLQEQMDRLADTSLVAGERSDASDHCLAGISRLSNEIKDASSYIPTYDQRIYAEAIKALQDKLTETRAAVQPRAKFSFKTKKNPSAISLSDAAEIAVQGRHPIPDYLTPDVSSRESSMNPTPIYSSTPVNEVEQLQLRPEIAPTSSPAILDEGKVSSLLEKKSDIRRPTFSNASSVSVDQHYGLHIMLPESASKATVPASITSLRHCVVDMSIPTHDGKPYASLVVKDVKESLLISGQVDGPAHITGVEHSVLVVSCRQFRMHNCVDVDVYLSCTSNPIIEDCSRIRFCRIPKNYALDQNHHESADKWDQVDDFKWIKHEPSPNWSILDPNDAVPEEVWAEMVPGGPCWSLEDILRATKVLRE
ncbi:putative tubulin-specific chaperone c [Talaromyces proteolyticus]|uniref:Tubulin-specific chaperone c n=1 Tax=Talaromyces proteolyticus TaxID=1131652 RepID=A0AAD4KRG1_9EURO|nr:putative tubulin-specific chaperone c [Talaromyces proteolyticus]KAH8693962.1 putative tubulin-specific chaperone c [Talaromyces proteolyticus]